MDKWLHPRQWDVITHMCPNSNGDLMVSLLNSGHGSVITSVLHLWNYLSLTYLMLLEGAPSHLCFSLSLSNLLNIEMIYMYIIHKHYITYTVTTGKSVNFIYHYNDVKMSAKASPITSLTIVFSTVYLHKSKKASKLRVTGLCAGNSPEAGEFSAKMASNAESVSIWWRHHVPEHIFNFRAIICSFSNTLQLVQLEPLIYSLCRETCSSNEH